MCRLTSYVFKYKCRKSFLERAKKVKIMRNIFIYQLLLPILKPNIE